MRFEVTRWLRNAKVGGSAYIPNTWMQKKCHLQMFEIIKSVIFSNSTSLHLCVHCFAIRTIVYLTFKENNYILISKYFNALSSCKRLNKNHTSFLISLHFKILFHWHVLLYTAVREREHKLCKPLITRRPLAEYVLKQNFFWFCYGKSTSLKVGAYNANCILGAF